MQTTFVRTPFLSLVLLLAACGGSTTAPVDDGDDAGNGDGREVLEAPSFATDVNEILQRRGCASSSCHGAPNGQDGLRLTSSAAANYAAIVGVDANSEDYLLVDPGNAQDSYIVIRVEGRQTQGSSMPKGAAPLDEIDRANLRNWIDNGAPNN